MLLSVGGWRQINLITTGRGLLRLLGFVSPHDEVTDYAKRKGGKGRE